MSDSRSQPADRWHNLAQRCGAPGEASAAVLQQLLTAYREPGRYYHTLDHVADLLETLRTYAPPNDLELLELAAWFHDVVYDPRASDNEERSAEMASTALRRLHLPSAVVERVAQLIRMTRDHRVKADDAAAHLFLDADLAILGAAPAKYKEYARAIRQEYAWVAEPDYRAGRRAVLQRFLERPRIFGTEALYQRREAAARRNLTEEIAELS
jgi:predicted metal-dependent HD superfamily phosphohydrolase